MRDPDEFDRCEWCEEKFPVDALTCCAICGKPTCESCGVWLRDPKIQGRLFVGISCAEAEAHG